MMNLEQATALREKFYAGTSTVSEERRLLDFLRSESCPPAWQADRAVLEPLVALPETECSSPPLGLETRIAARLAQHAAPRKHHYLLWRRLGAVAGIAATMTALFLGLHFSGGTPPTVYSDTCCTPQQAASETRDMLFYVSEQLNMGVEAEEELGGPCP